MGCSPGTPAALGQLVRMGKEVLGELPPDESKEAAASSCGEEHSPKYNYFCSYNKEKSYGGGKTGINSKPDYVAVPGAPAWREGQPRAKEPLPEWRNLTLPAYHLHGSHRGTHMASTQCPTSSLLGRRVTACKDEERWPEHTGLSTANTPLQAKPPAAACPCWFLCVLSRQLCAHQNTRSEHTHPSGEREVMGRGKRIGTKTGKAREGERHRLRGVGCLGCSAPPALDPATGSGTLNPGSDAPGEGTLLRLSVQPASMAREEEMLGGGSRPWCLHGHCCPQPSVPKLQPPLPWHGSRALHQQLQHPLAAPLARVGERAQLSIPACKGIPSPWQPGGRQAVRNQRPESGIWGPAGQKWRGDQARGATSAPRTSSPRHGAGKKPCGTGQRGDGGEEEEEDGGRRMGRRGGRGSAEAAKQSEERGRAVAGGGGGVGRRMGRKTRRKRREQPGRRQPARTARPRGPPGWPLPPAPGRLPEGPG